MCTGFKWLRVRPCVKLVVGMVTDSEFWIYENFLICGGIISLYRRTLLHGSTTYVKTIPKAQKLISVHTKKIESQKCKYKLLFCLIH
jgi:hypothetical protein